MTSFLHLRSLHIDLLGSLGNCSLIKSCNSQYAPASYHPQEAIPVSREDGLEFFPYGRHGQSSSSVATSEISCCYEILLPTKSSGYQKLKSSVSTL